MLKDLLIITTYENLTVFNIELSKLNNKLMTNGLYHFSLHA